jgi:SulP family sulfate permease
VLIYYLTLLTKAIPSALAALIIGALTAIFWDGMCPLGDSIWIPNLQIGIYSVLYQAYTLIVEYAAVLAVLGSIDSLLTSVIADNMTKTRHNSNREIGQGIGNMLLLLWGIPGAGATKGT